MKKIINFIPYILFVLCLSGCQMLTENNTDFLTRISAQAEYYNLETCIEKSDCAILGEYVETFEFDNYVEHKFKVIKTLFGECSEDEIYLFRHKTDIYIPELEVEYATDSNIYREGEEYILLVECQKSVFFDHDRYLLMGDAYLPLNQKENWSTCNVPIPDIITADGQSLDNYIIAYRSSCLEPSDCKTEEIRFTKSNDIEEILEVSDYIIKAQVDSLMSQGLDTPCETYLCTPVELVRGERLICDESNRIGIIVPVNSVEIGKTYYFIVNHVDETAILYIVTSNSSILEENTLLVDMMMSDE